MNARNTGQVMQALPEEARPLSRDDALAVQDAVVARLGGPGGWKTAPPQPGHEPVFTPLPAIHIHVSPAALSGVWPFRPEIEVEIAVKLGRELPQRPGGYVRDDLAAAIVSAHPAIEVIGSRFTDRKGTDPLTSIADLRSNVSTVVGPPLANWRALEFATVGMRLSFDGVQVAEVSGGHSTTEVLDALANLATHAMTRREHLKAGHVIITGARIKPVRLPHSVRSVAAEVAGLGRVAFEMRG
jgi:2-keto-4-pentenoate hydratase